MPEEDLGRLPPPSTPYLFRGWSVRRRNPFFAGAKLPSAKVSSQSRCRCSSSSPRNLRRMASQTPDGEPDILPFPVPPPPPAGAGRGVLPGQVLPPGPERSTHQMPSKHRRLSIRWRPPALDGLVSGNNGSIFSHRSSVRSGSYRGIKRNPFHVAFEHKSDASANLYAIRF